MRKYSERFIQKSSILSKAKIGFEFELYMRDLSYYKTLELLNQVLSPVKVWGFRQYHSDFEPDEKNFKLEPDLSLGSNGCEIITGPLDYFSAKYYLVKIIKFINDWGYATSKAAIHFNISFTNEGEKDLNDLNILKLILRTDEDEIFRAFPGRKGNVYAKSIKKIIPFKDYDFKDISIYSIKNNLRLPSDKYYGINFLHINKPHKEQRLEYRYIGGKDYPQNVGRLLYFMDRFIIDAWECIDTDFDSHDIGTLNNYLSQNIDNMKNFSSYDSFIVEYPGVVIQVDQNNHYDVVSAYFPKIKDKIFTLVDSTKDLRDCIVNFVTKEHRIEVVGGNIIPQLNISGFDFINSTISEGIFEDCNFIDVSVTNSQIIRSKVWGSQIKGSKVLNTSCEASNLDGCFFMGGFLDSQMTGGVFRSGRLGPNSQISAETKIISQSDNFFDTEFDDDQYYKDTKMANQVKVFKKTP